jgi:hypothetical protein
MTPFGTPGSFISLVERIEGNREGVRGVSRATVSMQFS